MIYDNIKNIALYKGLSPALDVALDYIASVRLPMENGSTLLEHGVKAIVSEYTTKTVEPRGYEAHIKYADVQFLLSGSELMKCSPLQKLEPSTPYEADKDRRFYQDSPDGFNLQLGGGYFAVVFPDDAHMPGLAAGEPMMVKKLVLKVPVAE